MTIEQAKKALEIAFKCEYPITVNLWGGMGIGKSRAVMDYALENNLDLIELRLGQQEEGDLIGMPKATEGTKVTEWYKPCWWPKEGTKGILFLDEFNRAGSISVLQAMFQLILPTWDEKLGRYVHRLHTHLLPEGWKLVAACNPDNGEYTVQTLDDALMDRFLHLKIDYNHAAFMGFAKKHYENTTLVSFLQESREMFNHYKSFGLDIKATPRSTEMLNHLLNTFGGETALVQSDSETRKVALYMISGLMGDDYTEKFWAYLQENFVKPLTADDIINGSFEKTKKFVDSIMKSKEKRVDILNDMNHSLCTEIEEKKVFGKNQLSNILNYLQLLPLDMYSEMLGKLESTKNGNKILNAGMEDEHKEAFAKKTCEAFGKDPEEIKKAIKAIYWAIEQHKKGELSGTYEFDTEKDEIPRKVS